MGILTLWAGSRRPFDRNCVNQVPGWRILKKLIINGHPMVGRVDVNIAAGDCDSHRSGIFGNGICEHVHTDGFVVRDRYECGAVDHSIHDCSHGHALITIQKIVVDDCHIKIDGRSSSWNCHRRRNSQFTGI